MSAVSGPQYRAMQAAAHGKSTLGIPAKVGKEFVDATPSDKRSQFSHSAAKVAKKRAGRK